MGCNLGLECIMGTYRLETDYRLKSYKRELECKIGTYRLESCKLELEYIMGTCTPGMGYRLGFCRL